uniref:Mitochondrial resolvase Ydc2 catalytic domain-containing protein n=1 Tax=viral metagenome TaxID=1070528 RepID=A0A6C0B7T3_9ZZZZ
MKLLSFDIGIKNMALCCFDISGQDVTILDWTVLNLLEEEAPKQFCSCLLKPKKGTVTSCNKIAKYRKNETLYCEKHANSNKDYLIPFKECSQTSLKKLKVDELKVVCNKYAVPSNLSTKKAILETLDNYFARMCYEPIQIKKRVGAGDTDLVTIGKNMKKLFDEIENIQLPDIVIIENQISPIANRMKTIQGMVAQYFIMKDSDVQIDFVSSANKLKDFKPLENTLRCEPDEKTYQKNKKNGVEYCFEILNSRTSFDTWKHVLNTKKKDDLADCFLQGIWFMNNKLNIMRRT